MIDRIGLSVSANRIIPSFRAEEQAEQNKITIPELKPNNKGLEALAAYNEAMIKKEISDNKLNIEPLTPLISEPIDIENFEGEKIYTSEGKLQSIIRRDETTYTIYTPDSERPEAFSLIEVFNKENGKYPIKRQTKYSYNNAYFINIEEINPRTGELIKDTSYDDGKIVSISKNYNTPDGKTIYVSYDFENKDYFANITYKNNKNREIYASFNDNKQLEYVSEYRIRNGANNETTVDFYNGAPYKITNTREIIIPNTMGKENIDELKPAKYFNKIENIKEIDGEKTYYSNGALESNTFDSDSGKTIAHFLPDGSCDKINTDKKEIIFAKDSEKIIETLNDGKVKETILYNDGDYSVKISDNNTYKKALFSKNNKPKFYEEGSIVNDNHKCKKRLSFNEEGMLDWA